MTKKESKKKPRNTLEKRPDRSERGLQLYLGASVSFELPLSSASLLPSTKHQAPSSLGLSTIVKLLPLCPTKIYCTACISSNVVQPPQPRWSGIPEAVNSSRLKIHSIRAHCIHLHPLAVQRHFSPHLLFHHLHLFNLLCRIHLRPCWVVCHQQTLQHTGNL